MAMVSQLLVHAKKKARRDARGGPSCRQLSDLFLLVALGLFSFLPSRLPLFSFFSFSSSTPAPLRPPAPALPASAPGTGRRFFLRFPPAHAG
jgi:hypothetical protein